MAAGIGVDTKRPLAVAKEDGEVTIVKNIASPTIYYKAGQNGESVSSTSNDGSLAKGASLTLTQTEFFIATESGALVEIETKPAPTGFSESIITVVESNEFNIRNPRFNGGAKGDNKTDDSVAINECVAALSKVSPQGGEVICPPGRYVFEAKPLEAKSLTSLTIVGRGGRDGNDIGGTYGAATQFLYNGTGARGFDFRKNFGLTVRAVEFTATNSANKEILVDMESAKACQFYDSKMIASGATTIAETTGLNISGKADSCNFYSCTFASNLFGVLGGTETEAEQISAMHNFNGCSFLSNQEKHILNAGPKWTFMGCTFEQLRNNKGEEKATNAIGCYANQGTRVTESLSFIGCSIGDGPVLKGNQIEFTGKGLTLIGGGLGVGEKGIVLGAKSQGIVVMGTKIVNLTTAVEIGAECSRIYYAPNSVTVSGTEIVNPENAEGSVLPTGKGKKWKKIAGAAGEELKAVKELANELREVAISLGHVKE